MADLDVSALAKVMLSAALKAVGPDLQAPAKFLEQEFVKLGTVFLQVQQGRKKKEISDDEARILVDMQKKAARSALLTIEGFGEIVAVKALGAAISAVAGTVNQEVGMPLV